MQASVLKSKDWYFRCMNHQVPNFKLQQNVINCLLELVDWFDLKYYIPT